MESKRRTYTSEQRVAAVADVVAMGVIGASRKHGIPQSCVSRWASVAGVAREAGAALAQATPAVMEEASSPRGPEQRAIPVVAVAGAGEA